MDLISELQQIGLTEYEAKVYLALLHNHPATGYQLSKDSGVPRSMVYEVLKRLHGRGIALETIENRSTLYRPLAPELFLTRYESELVKRLENLRPRLEELYQTTVDDRVWSIVGRRATLSYAGKLILQDGKEKFLVLTDQDLADLYAKIKQACDAGMEVNALLTGKDSLDCGRVAYHPPLESEMQGLTGTLLVVSDDREALIASSSVSRETTATITRNRDLVLIARQFVWMELFAQRVYSRLGSDLLERLDPGDRRIFESLQGSQKER